MNSVRVRFTHQTLETFGTCSLLGMISEKIDANKALTDYDEVVLEFDQTDLGFRTQNKGPKLILMPEFVPLCLIEDILSLVSLGIMVKLAEVTVSE